MIRIIFIIIWFVLLVGHQFLYNNNNLRLRHFWTGIDVLEIIANLLMLSGNIICSMFGSLMILILFIPIIVLAFKSFKKFKRGV